MQDVQMPLGSANRLEWEMEMTKFLSGLKAGMERVSLWTGKFIGRIIALVIIALLVRYFYSPEGAPSVMDLPLAEAKVGDVAGVFFAMLVIVRIVFDD